MSRGGLDVSRPRKSERRGRPCFTTSRRLSSRSRIQFELFDTGEGLGRLLSGGAIYYARLQAPARCVIPIKIFRRPAIREADFVAAALGNSLVPNDADTALHGCVPMSSLPLKPEPGISCFWRLLIFAEWQPRTPFGRAENPLITFIGEPEKQIRVRPDSGGKGQSAISNRAGLA